ncbi:MAG: DUF5640 domain-containing protein [Erysipelotrichales bacterium]|nr:DUF5640 domain-containing protein [Erysipelotrichales bacterium]
MKKLFGIIILIFGIFLLTGCNAGEINQDFVGTWEWLHGPEWRYVFNADGTGNRGVPGDTETFSWSTNNDRININRNQAASGEIRNERWSFIISGNSLTLNSLQEAGLSFSYIRRLDGQQNPLIIGIWQMNFDLSLHYIFKADGTGERGFDGSEMEAFTWSTSNNHLNMDMIYQNQNYIRNERWTFTVSENVLTISSLQEAGLTISFVRYSERTQNQNLIGRWNWESNFEWFYLFNPDGTGSFGLSDRTNFSWSTSGNILFIDIFYDGYYYTDIWTFMISGNRLTLTSLQFAGETYSYIRNMSGDLL